MTTIKFCKLIWEIQQFAENRYVATKEELDTVYAGIVIANQRGRDEGESEWIPSQGSRGVGWASRLVGLFH